MFSNRHNRSAFAGRRRAPPTSEDSSSLFTCRLVTIYHLVDRASSQKWRSVEIILEGSRKRLPRSLVSGFAVSTERGRCCVTRSFDSTLDTESWSSAYWQRCCGFAPTNAPGRSIGLPEVCRLCPNHPHHPRSSRFGLKKPVTLLRIASFAGRLVGATNARAVGCGCRKRNDPWRQRRVLSGARGHPVESDGGRPQPGTSR